MGDQQPRAAAAGGSRAPDPLVSDAVATGVPAAALEALFAHAPAPALALDAALHVVDVNPAFAALCDMPAGHLRGLPCAGLFRDERIPELLVSAREAGEPRCAENIPVRRAASGEEVRLDWTAVPTREGMLLFSNDVTARARALAAEQECTAVQMRSDAALSSILNNMQDTVYRSRLSGEVIWVSPSVEQLLGYRPEELIGTDAAAFYEDRAMRAELLDALRRQGGRIRSFQTNLVHRDGARVRVHLNARYFFDAAGRVAGIEGSLHDVTEHGRMAEALRASEARLAETQAIARLGSWEWDGPSGRVSVSAETVHLLGAEGDGEAWTLEAFLAYVHPDDREAVAAALERAAREHLPYETTFRLTANENGEPRTIRHLGLIEEEADGRWRMAGAVQDVTELARAQSERERYQAQLLQAQKMEAVGILAGGMAHDFNNLLTTIGGFTELALEQTGPDDPRRGDLDEVRMATERAAALTRQLLLFSRKQPLNIELQDINRCIERLHNMLSRLLGEDVAIVIEPQSALWPVCADGVSIDQLVMNLSINARDAMPDGGRLTIATAMTTVTPADAARHPDARAGDFVCIRVADTGVGMDTETLANIFDPFFTTKDLGKGTGLGMSVVHGIARQHGGWVEVDSVPGRGSVFRVFLPANREGDPLSGSGAPEGRVRPGNGARVLVVEDEPSLRAFAETALSQNGYRVVACGSTAEARGMLNGNPEAFDLVFSDVVLPDGNGIELARGLQKDCPELPVLLCSGYPGQKAGWAVMKKEGMPFIQKPYTLVQLLDAVHGQLAPRRRA